MKLIFSLFGPQSQMSLWTLRNQSFFFTKSFLTKHLITFKEAKKRNCIPFELEGRKFLDEQKNKNAPNSVSILCHGNKVYNELLKLGKKKEDFQAAFKAINFNEDILEAFDMGFKHGLSQKNAVAIHIRGGDIIYDKNVRENHFESKALPVSIALEIIKFVRNSGGFPIVFAQDKFAVGKVRNLKNSSLASDFYHSDKRKN
jgi:hypothetical protein